nr:4-coumarate--CoA ligase-like 5 [Aegilops tauschii subsp. strangulata]
MAEQAATPAGIDPRSGFCAATRTFHNVCSSSAGALPPESLPVTAAAAAYAFSLLASPIALRSSTPPQVPVLHVALMSIGTVVSPANPASTPEEYAHQVALSRPVVAFAAPEVAAKLPGHVRCVVFGSDAQESLSSAGAKAAPPPAVTLLPLPLFNVFGFMMFDFGAALRVILRYRVTLLPAAPPVLVAMIKSKEARHGDLSSLLVIAVGGAPLGRDVAERFAAVFTNVQVVQVKHETPCRLQNTTESSMQAGQEEEG